MREPLERAAATAKRAAHSAVAPVAPVVPVAAVEAPMPPVAEGRYMLPWGHAAFGYLLYSLGWRTRRGTAPESSAVLALGVGTQFPDLVDKPLAWTFDVLPTGRSLAHSLLAAVFVIAVVVWAARRVDNVTAGVAFGVGYLSHLVADTYYFVFRGTYDEMSFLLWPLLPLHGTDENYSFIHFFLNLELTSVTALGLVFTVLAVGLWVYDGKPGLDIVRSVVWESKWLQRQ